MFDARNAIIRMRLRPEDDLGVRIVRFLSRLCTYSEGGIREQPYTTIERKDFDDSLVQ